MMSHFFISYLCCFRCVITINNSIRVVNICCFYSAQFHLGVPAGESRGVVGFSSSSSSIPTYIHIFIDNKGPTGLWHVFLSVSDTNTELFERSYNWHRACQTTLLLRDSLSLSRSFLLWLQPWSLSTIMLLWHSFLIIIIIIIIIMLQ